MGDKGPLVEEINIRLTGFGGTTSPSVALDLFTKKTEAAVMQFQRDYMATGATGKVCGPTLAALDAFCAQYPIEFTTMKCRCGHCGGFGNELTDSSKAGIYKDKAKTKAHQGIEYPGLHRSLLWALRAAVFYISSSKNCPGYKFLKISSGYRCWHDNALHARTTTNHMGNALDIQFSQRESNTRCAGNDIETIRSKIFIEHLGAQLGWNESNRLSLERAEDGATSWVHVDVRQYEEQNKAARYYAVTQSAMDGDSIIEMAQRENRFALICCRGLPIIKINSASPVQPSNGNTNEKRLRASTLKISQKGIEFIKGWEQCKLQPYNDSQGHCTIGWGHAIKHQKCETLNQNSDFQKYIYGISQPDADALLLKDIEKTEIIIQSRIQVPLFQHEYDALVSLILNIGSFEKCPKLLSKINTRDYNGCCDEFADITNNNTPGLVARRKCEMKLFRNNSYNTTH